MATFKFFNIGKANEEITRLEAENIKLQEEAKTAKENAEQVAGAAEENRVKLEKAEKDLQASQSEISTLKTKLEKSEADLKTANEKLANPPAQIVEIASRKAAEITAGQGQPPVGSTPTTETASGDILAQHDAIADPAERALFYQKHKAAYDAAWNAKHKK